MEKLKILFIRRTPDNKYSGIAHYCRSLHDLLAGDARLEPLAVEDYPQRRLPLLHFCYLLRPLRRAISRADIVHVNGYTELGAAQALVVAKLMGRRTVYTAHWHPFDNLRHPLGGRLFFTLVMKPAIRLCADVVTTINSEDTRFFSSFHRHVVQIPHWYRGDPPQPKHPRPPLPPLPQHPQRPMVMFVGRLTDPVKGLDHLLQLPEGQYDIHLVGNGPKPPRADMTQHCNIPYAELCALYARAQLLVIPSKYEAFSYAALEALMHGTPVVASDRVRIADYLEGLQGLRIFTYGDYAAFRRAVSESVGQPVDTPRVARTFDPGLIRQRYHDVYTTTATTQDP